MRRVIFIALFLTVFFIGSFYRIYNLPQRLNFSSEQGLALLTSSDYLSQGFSLLGQKTFLRTTSQGHILFSGAIYNYSLVPLILAFNHDPVAITYIFSLLNILTGLVAFFLVNKIHNKMVAFFVFFLFMFSSQMISHSLYIWILHYLPLISFLSIYSLISYTKTRRNIHVILLGIYCGLGVNFEYFYSLTLILIFVYLIIISKNRLSVALLFIVGSCLGNFTMVLFDLRHNLYHFRELLQYSKDTFSNPGQSKIDSYHFFQYWSLLFWVGGYLLNYMWKKSRMIVSAVCLLYILTNLSSSNMSLTRPIGMPGGLNFEKIDRSARLIAVDNGPDFNIVNLVDSDFRAYTLRYLVTYRYNRKPLDMEKYTESRNLYILGKRGFKSSDSGPWEVSTYTQAEQLTLAKIDENVTLYKLVK